MQIGDFYWEIPTSFPELTISSFYFVAFALVVFFLGRVGKCVLRPYVLLVANLVFLWSFSHDFYYLIVIAACALLSYICGIVLEKTKSKLVLGLFIIPYVLILIFFKYQGLLFNTNLLMPLGLSFYTFKIISYLCDVNKGKTKAEKNILYYFDYVLFFPCITAGPINRVEGFLTEIRNRKEFDYKDAKNGGLQMMLGIFEKVVFSDFIASVVTRILDNGEVYGPIVILGIIMYSFNIYLDFDACSNIAIGCARLLGFNLDKNFNSPYLSKNLQEFWRRWHISLSSFFRDYIYIPLGGSRKGKLIKYINTMIVFLVSGMWHGNTLNFLIWGLLHGLISVLENIIENIFKSVKIPKVLKILLDFVRILFNFALVSLLWLVFRYQTMGEVIETINRIFASVSYDITIVGITKNEFYWLLFIVVVTIVGDVLRNNFDVLYYFSKWFILFRWVVYVILIVLFLVFGMYGGSFDPNDFIYQFF